MTDRPRNLSEVTVPHGYPTALIFLDESGSKKSASKFFVVGAVKVRDSGSLMRELRDIRDRHSYNSEFRFSQVTRGKVPVYCEVIDCLEGSDAHIAACVVDRTNRDPFQGVPAWEVLTKVTTQLVTGCINRRELVSLIMDTVSTPKGCAIDDVVRKAVNKRLRSTSVVTASCVDSKANDGLQLADLVAGSIGFYRRTEGGGGAPANAHKAKVAGRLALAFGASSFGDARADRLNIATFRGRPAPERRLQVVRKITPRAG